MMNTTEKLRYLAETVPSPFLFKVADEIGRIATLEAEIKRLREALARISVMRTAPDEKLNTFTLVAAHNIARAALGDTHE